MIFKNQKERGTQGAGLSLYIPDKRKIIRIRKKHPKTVLKSALIDKAVKGSILLFHHRFPTSTPNIAKCNHPICNEDKTLHLIHNGWLTSPYHHFQRLREKGHRFETQIKQLSTARLSYSYYNTGEVYNYTDTESIVHELEDNVWENNWSKLNLIKAIEETVDNIYGAITFAILKQGIPEIFLHRGSPPCSLYLDKRENIWFSSLFPENRKSFRLIKEMEEGEIASIGEKGYISHKIIDPFKSNNHFGTMNRFSSLDLFGTISTERSKTICDHYTSDTKNIGEVIEDVWITLSENGPYIGRYISLSQIADILSNELESSRIQVSTTRLYALATEIWESI